MREVLGHEFFLLRHADSHPKKIGACFAYFFCERVTLLVAERPERRRKGPRNSQPWKTRLQHVRQLLSNPWFAAKKEMSENAIPRMLAEIQNEIRSINSSN